MSLPNQCYFDQGFKCGFLLYQRVCDHTRRCPSVSETCVHTRRCPSVSELAGVRSFVRLSFIDGIGHKGQTRN